MTPEELYEKQTKEEAVKDYGCVRYHNKEFVDWLKASRQELIDLHIKEYNIICDQCGATWDCLTKMPQDCARREDKRNTIERATGQTIEDIIKE